jgi:hypothetical protein
LEKILFPDSDAGIEVVGNVGAVVGVGAAPIDGAVEVVVDGAVEVVVDGAVEVVVDGAVEVVVDGAVEVVELPLWEGTRIDVSTEASTV